MIWLALDSRLTCACTCDKIRQILTTLHRYYYDNYTVLGVSMNLHKKCLIHLFLFWRLQTLACCPVVLYHNLFQNLRILIFCRISQRTRDLFIWNKFVEKCKLVPSPKSAEITSCTHLIFKWAPKTNVWVHLSFNYNLVSLGENHPKFP